MDKQQDNEYEGADTFPLRPAHYEDKENLKNFIEKIIKYEVKNH